MHVFGSKSSKFIYALLDEGSTVTLINSTVINEIKAKSSSVNVTLKGIGDGNMHMFAYKKVDLKIKSDSVFYHLQNVLVVDNLALPIQCISPKLSKICMKETGVHFEPYKEAPVMLIGQSHCKLILTREFHILNTMKLIMSRCILGWSIHGQLREDDSAQVNSIVTVETEENCLSCYNNYSKLNKEVKLYFDLESLGVSSFRKVSESDKRAIEILDKTSRYINGSWEVGLLWKSDDIITLNGRTTAFRRLQLLERKLDRNKEFAELYYREMQRLIDNGFAEVASSLSENSRLWYLAHFGVQNPNKPGKVRLVFDAAAETASVSFNKLLLPGPSLLKSLPGVIMRFRQYAYAIKADLRDMFLKIKIREEDRDAQRFLWRGNDRTSEPIE